MSLLSIQRALEARLAAQTGALATAYENANFTPTTGTPYQQVHLLPAEPNNDELGRQYIEQGIFQVTLCFPINAGPMDVRTAVDALIAWFARGTTLTADGQTTRITRTPKAAPAFQREDRYCTPVSIPYESLVSY